MNGRFFWRSLSGLSLTLAVLFLAGCATAPKVDWNSRVGSYTFDQAVMDFGPPDRATQLSDGKTVAEWIRHRRGGVSFGLGTGFVGGNTGVGVGQSVSTGFPDKVLRLTFAPDGKLVTWRKNY